MIRFFEGHKSNAILVLVGVVALVHSAVYFGTKELPEAALAGLLFLKGFSNRRQPTAVVWIGFLATILTWAANSTQLVPNQLRQILSWCAVVFFLVLALSKYFFEASRGRVEHT